MLITLHLYISFAVQIFPCDAKPCDNGATCRNDETDISVYHCDCLEGYFGKNCQGNKTNTEYV